LSFESRVNLNDRLNNFVEAPKKEVGPFIEHVYDMNRALRYLEDYVLEVYMSDQSIADKEYHTLQGKGLYFMVPPNQNFHGPDDLQSGDVILSRGSAFTSAAIARIGVNDSQFSHLTFVYRNPEENGKLYTIEAHIEIGSVVAPFQVHIDQKNSRTVVYRYEDAELAHKAATYMYHKVKTQSDTGKNIEYNFSMQLNDASKLFCSQVIYDGFQQASNKTIDIPKFKTQFNSGLITFLNRMGIPASLENISHMETFSPGDIEYDPRFSLIAEWKDPNQLRDSRLKDAVLTKMFSWMENDRYHIQAPVSVKAMSRFTWLIRRIPLVQKLVEKKLPLNMNVEQLKIFLTLDKIGGVLKNAIIKLRETKKHPLTIKEMFDFLEEFRVQDGQSKKHLFHQWFHERENA
jgi:hypothetical protein